MKFLSRSKLQLQNRTCKPGAIFTAICRHDIAGFLNMFDFGATKIAYVNGSFSAAAKFQPTQKGKLTIIGRG